MKTPGVVMWLQFIQLNQSWESGQASSKETLSLELALDAYGMVGGEEGTRMEFAWGISKHRESQERKQERSKEGICTPGFSSVFVTFKSLSQWFPIA